MYINLQGINIKYAKMNNSNLDHVDLSYSNLRNFNLKDTNLRYDNLCNSDAMGASMCGTNLSYATILNVHIVNSLFEIPLFEFLKKFINTFDFLKFQSRHCGLFVHLYKRLNFL